MNKKSSNASSTITSEPNLDHTLPSSNPITPAPITPSFFGTEVNSNAPVLSVMFSLHGAIGISIGSDPEAKIILSALIVDSSPTLLMTLISLFANNVAVPSIGVTLFALNKPNIPVVSFVTTPSFLSIILGKSKAIFLISIPWPLKCLVAS